ncbi:MAG TPA: hypothetical protein VI139_08185 [Gemmatimonadales bacterium]
MLLAFLLGPLVVFTTIYSIKRTGPKIRDHEERIRELEDRLAEIREQLELTDRIVRDQRSRSQVPPARQ